MISLLNPHNRWKSKLEEIMMTDWARLLKRFLEVQKGKYFNRPWFIGLFIQCLDLALYPVISDKGLRVTCRAAFSRILIAKQHKPMFRSGQLKLLNSAYITKNRDADWLVTSHFAHVAEVNKDSNEVWLYPGQKRGLGHSKN